jgi:hypothetical protein
MFPKKLTYFGRGARVTLGRSHSILISVNSACDIKKRFTVEMDYWWQFCKYQLTQDSK